MNYAWKDKKKEYGKKLELYIKSSTIIYHT